MRKKNYRNFNGRLNIGRENISLEWQDKPPVKNKMIRRRIGKKRINILRINTMMNLKIKVINMLQGITKNHLKKSNGKELSNRVISS